MISQCFRRANRHSAAYGRILNPSDPPFTSTSAEALCSQIWAKVSSRSNTIVCGRLAGGSAIFAEVIRASEGLGSRAASSKALTVSITWPPGPFFGLVTCLGTAEAVIGVSAGVIVIA